MARNVSTFAILFAKSSMTKRALLSLGMGPRRIEEEQLKAVGFDSHRNAEFDGHNSWGWMSPQGAPGSDYNCRAVPQRVYCPEGKSVLTAHSAAIDLCIVKIWKMQAGQVMICIKQTSTFVSTCPLSEDILFQRGLNFGSLAHISQNWHKKIEKHRTHSSILPFVCRYNTWCQPLPNLSCIRSISPSGC